MVYPTLKIHTVIKSHREDDGPVGISVSWKVCVHLFSVSRPTLHTCWAPAPNPPRKVPSVSTLSMESTTGGQGFGASGREPGPSAVCRLEAWPPKPQLESAASPGPVWAICVTTVRRGNVGQTRPGRGRSRSRPQGDGSAGRTQAPRPAPRRFPSSLLTRNSGVHPQVT